MAAYPAWAVFAGFVLVFGAAGTFAVSWFLWLERKPYPEQVRRGLLVVLLGFTWVELLFASSSKHCYAVFCIVMLCNGWGYLDAVLRFPKLHDPESFFVLKQVTLILLKIIGTVMGLASCLGSSPFWFVVLLLANTVFVPLLYMQSLPLDASALQNRLDAYDVVDEDILLRCARLFVDRDLQREVCRKVQHRWLKLQVQRASDARVKLSTRRCV